MGKISDFKLQKQHVSLLHNLRTHSTLTPRQKVRAELLLALHDDLSPMQAAEKVGVNISTVHRLMHRYNDDGLECLFDRKRSGRPVRITPEKQDQIVALATEVPPEGSWSLRTLARTATERNIVTRISHSQISSILSSRSAEGTSIDS